MLVLLNQAFKTLRVVYTISTAGPVGLQSGQFLRFTRTEIHKPRPLK